MIAHCLLRPLARPKPIIYCGLAAALTALSQVHGLAGSCGAVRGSC